MKKSKKIFIVAGYFTVTVAVFTFATLLLIFPQQAAQGVEKGINLCLYTLMPSMYPFMFVSSFVVSSSISEKMADVFAAAMNRIFRLPGVCGVIILLSMVGGLPVGARAIEAAYERGSISKNEGQRLLTFCINPGPAFVITSVGFCFLSSRLCGAIIYASLILSSITTGFLTRFVFHAGTDFNTDKYVKTDKVPLHESFVASVNTAITGITNVSAWVILFSCVTELISLLPFSDGTRLFVTAITEMTNGAQQAAGNVPVPLIAGIIGFTGLCGQMQIMPVVIKMKMKLKHFWAARVVNSALATVIAMLMFDFLPVSVETLKLGSLPDGITKELSLPVCIGVLLMCVLLLLGDNFHIKKRQKEALEKT